LKVIKDLDDQEILNLLKKDDNLSINKALKVIYEEVFPIVKKYILKNNGSEEEALDVFQECTVIFYNQVKEGRYEMNAKISTYMYSIARNQWYQQLRKKKRIDYKSEMDETTLVATHESDVSSLHATNVVDRLMEKLDGQCKKVLLMFYFKKQSMKEIMIEFELGSEQAAKTKKLRCMKKLEELFESHNITRDLFTL